jgi:hypothetical protein
MSIGIKKGKDVNWAGLAFGLDILLPVPKLPLKRGFLLLAAGAKL